MSLQTVLVSEPVPPWFPLPADKTDQARAQKMGRTNRLYMFIYLFIYLHCFNYISITLNKLSSTKKINAVLIQNAVFCLCNIQIP